MKVHKPSEIPAQPVNAPLFTGGPVTRQTLLTPEASNNFNLGIVNFSPGARNKMHTHSSDQVLFVTAGKGIIATETEQQIIIPGDVVHIPSEEKHWHGATPDSAFSHIALTAKGSTTTQVEPSAGTAAPSCTISCTALPSKKLAWPLLTSCGVEG